MEPELQKMASELASHGRKTDSMVMHISPEELEMMEELFPDTLTVNPDTGMIEAFGWLQTLMEKVGTGIKGGINMLGKGTDKIGEGLDTVTTPLSKAGEAMGGPIGGNADPKFGETGGPIGPAQKPGLLGGLQENISTFKGGLNNILDKTGTTQEQRGKIMGAYNQGRGGVPSGSPVSMSSGTTPNIAKNYPQVTNAGVNPVAGGAVDPYADLPPGGIIPGQSLVEMYGKRSGGRASEQRRMREMMMSIMGTR